MRCTAEESISLGLASPFDYSYIRSCPYCGVEPKADELYFIDGPNSWWAECKQCGGTTPINKTWLNRRSRRINKSWIECLLFIWNGRPIELWDMMICPFCQYTIRDTELVITDRTIIGTCSHCMSIPPLIHLWRKNIHSTFIMALANTEPLTYKGSS